MMENRRSILSIKGKPWRFADIRR